ncbi:MAG: hypothetical protein C0625_10105 [Arcobacter sp.]|nr:MAG: hypothetical protein C0625_10105 [Arcobacter sp.]
METVIREAPNPIMIHNEKGKVLMINQVWEELCEYKYEEIDTIEKWTEKVYGKKASTVKSYIEKLFEKKQRVDEGEFIIISKSGKKLIWNFSSTSLGVINNQKTIITSAMDVTKLKEKDHILHIQSRHAAMGEMLSNISHQWRQPLSVISTIATGSSITYSVDNFDEKEFQSNMMQINSTVQYLSRTINDFSNFFNPNKEKKNFNMEELFEKTFTLISSQFHNKHINIIKNIEDIKIYGFENELIKVIINILNNAKDSLEINNIKEKYVFINVYTKDEKLVISIKDNAKGIKKDIIDKIFEPYFTTKHQYQGTGIGLYMSQEIIEKHMNGKIEVSNETFSYNNKNYTGAQFMIYLQKK